MNPEVELSRLIRDVSREQAAAVMVGVLEVELDRARAEQRQAKARVDAVKAQLKRMRALSRKSSDSVGEWFSPASAETETEGAS